MEKENSSLDILWKIKRNLQQEKKAFNYPDMILIFLKDKKSLPQRKDTRAKI